MVVWWMDWLGLCDDTVMRLGTRISGCVIEVDRRENETPNTSPSLRLDISTTCTISLAAHDYPRLSLPKAYFSGTFDRLIPQPSPKLLPPVIMLLRPDMPIIRTSIIVGPRGEYKACNLVPHSPNASVLSSSQTTAQALALPTLAEPTPGN